MFTHIRHLFSYDPHFISIVHRYLFFRLDRRFLRSDLWLIAAAQLSQFTCVVDLLPNVQFPFS